MDLTSNPKRMQVSLVGETDILIRRDFAHPPALV
jgi:hypothetical protein